MSIPQEVLDMNHSDFHAWIDTHKNQLGTAEEEWAAAWLSILEMARSLGVDVSAEVRKAHYEIHYKKPFEVFDKMIRDAILRNGSVCRFGGTIGELHLQS